MEENKDGDNGEEITAAVPQEGPGSYSPLTQMKRSEQEARPAHQLDGRVPSVCTVRPANRAKGGITGFTRQRL